MNRRMKAVIRFTVSNQFLVPFFILGFQFLDDTFIARSGTLCPAHADLPLFLSFLLSQYMAETLFLSGLAGRDRVDHPDREGRGLILVSPLSAPPTPSLRTRSHSNSDDRARVLWKAPWIFYIRFSS